MTNVERNDTRFSLKAYYDVPIGPLFFTPGLLGYGGIDTGFAVQALVKVPLYSSTSYLSLATGGEISVWDDRIGIGIPLEFTGVIPLTRYFQVSSSIKGQPMFYMGSNYTSFLYAIFVGVRIPVYND